MHRQNAAGRIAPGLFLAGLLALAYQILAHFIIPMAWAIVLAYVSWPLHRQILRLCQGRQTWAALTTTLLLTSVIVVPLVWASFLLQGEIAETYRKLPEWLDKKPMLPDFARHIPYLGQELAQRLEQSDTLRELLATRALPWARQYSSELLKVLGDVGYNAGKLGFTLLTAFFLYRDGPEVVAQTRKVLRMLLGGRLDAYVTDAEETLKAVVYGIVLTAIGQGVLAGLGYWFVGLDAPILLGVVTAFFAMIPFGTPLVWVSASLWLLADGQHWAGFALLLWGALVVSWVDNIIRPLVISGATRIPFLLVFFGVLGGLAHFGFIGLFLGPVVLGICFAVWREWLGHPPPE
ncbi:MAG: AI-2E family transporter [Candidatus Methylumidiphilus sp.]